MRTPELTFVYAYPLDMVLRQQHEADGKEYPARLEIRDTMQHWRSVWSVTNDERGILSKLVELTKRVPERNLECFVYGAGLNAMSTPFLMPTRTMKGSQWTDDFFIQIITHEMLHIFLTTDTDKYWEMVRDKYSDESPSCQNHIVLYAMLQKIYEDCFAALPPDFARDNLPPGYARAIEIVREEGSDALIAEYQALV